VIGGLVKPCAKEDSTSYLNDTNLWVLGLPLTVTYVATGEVESSNTYDSSNDTLLTRSRFGQTLMHYTFNSAGQLASFTDGNTNTTTLGNYKRGIPQAIGYPDGTSQSLAVDDFGQITSITDQAGHTTSYTYDPVGRVTQISYPSGDEQSWYPSVFSYDYVTAAELGIGAGHWRRIVSKGSARAVTYFDAMLRPVLSDSYIDGVAGSNTSTLTNYDSKGQKIFASYPSATALTFTTAPGTAGIKGSTSSYDALGRLVQTQQDSEVGVLTASTAYLSGARQQVTDPKGNITTTSYQVFDQPSYDAVIKVQAPAGVTQTIARDPYGNPTEIHQYGSFNGLGGDVTKTLIYDSYHRLCRTTEPESGSEVMGYDGANNLAWSVSGATLSNDGSCHAELAQSAGVTTRRYDAMNRIEQIQPPSGTPNTRYDYDAAGRMTCAVTGGTCSPLSGASIWRGTYNFRGMLTGESLQLSGQSAWGMGYAHDAYGSVSVIHYPDGENVSYAPDALGRATQVGAYATGLAYFADGAVKYFSYGNGAAYLADQNLRQLVSEFSYTKSSVTQLSEELSYDANGNITKVNDRTGDETDGPRSKTFGYDALNRLTSAQAAGLWGTESYTYDPLNNLRSRVSGGQTLTYNYNPLNQLASISGGAGSTFAYDNRGNVITKNGVNLAFDQKNQLTQIDGYGSYAYDAAGRRVMKTPPAGGAPTYYFYSQAGQLMYQVEPGKARTTSFIYLGRKLVGDNETLLLVAPGAVSFDPAPNNGSYTVSWGAVPAATSYLLQESANGGAWTTVYSGSAASKALSGREGGSYVYRVEGCVGTTCGGWTTSATLGVRPALPTVSVPSGTINGR
jgi:YD repeat-containing protein